MVIFFKAIWKLCLLLSIVYIPNIVFYINYILIKEVFVLKIPQTLNHNCVYCLKSKLFWISHPIKINYY